jgi:ketosteroid isomerase-like protein
MKKNFLLVLGLVLLSCSTAWVAGSQGGPAQVAETTPHKVKVKSGKIVERDKSKPVRRAIEEWYARNIAAFNAKDLAAIMALRADDFHTLTPDGKVNSRADMETRTKLFLNRIDHFISQEFRIGTIEVAAELASADVTQNTVRMQRLPDGTLHKVEASVVQRETWRRTTEGWKMYLVDNIRDGSVLVEDKPYTSSPR